MERRTLILLLVPFILALSTACDSGAPSPTAAAPTTVAQAGSKPTFTVISPSDGALVAQGSTLSVRSSAADPRGITKVELWVDGVLYRMDITREAEGLPSVTLTQTWPAADLGPHVLLLKAINRDGVASDPLTLSVSVVPQSAVTPSGTRTPSATAGAAPAATTTPVTVVLPSPTPSACEPDAAFVSDVTVPDGTAFKPGDPIVKTWRVRNSGKCGWEAGYQLTFVDGNQMGAAKTVAVPPTAPSATADITVRMTAPATPGDYTGKWKLTTTSGVLFGQTLTIIVKVSGPATPTPPPTPTVAPTPGAAAISFVADRTTIPYGDCATLKWDVDNALSVKLDGKGVVGHDARQACPTATTDYVLEVSITGGSDPVERTVTLTVNPPLRAAGATINAGDSVDLKTAIKNTGDVDILWDATKTLLPKNGATFAVIGIKRALTDVQQSECLNATNYSNGNLTSSSVASGIVICFKTGSGRNGKLFITDSSGPLSFQWVVW
ncbi:MAG: hypothetical protein HZB53_15520 [Chloroflexi bacterium]|nr:hypothetical protein [Chloroflexota bacterium]